MIVNLSHLPHVVNANSEDFNDYANKVVVPPGTKKPARWRAMCSSVVLHDILLGIFCSLMVPFRNFCE